jgi:DNA-binding CsgD family transcriptional regulator
MGMFVGRRREIDQLHKLLVRAQKDRTAVAAVIEGEPGIGKSRLLAEVRRLSPLNPIAQVAGYETERAIPFVAGRDLLAAVSASSPRAEAIINPSLSEPSRDEHASLALFEAAHRALGHIDSLLVIVDDFQWCDEHSIALLHYLLRGRRDEGGSIGLIVAGRSSPQLSSFAISLQRLLQNDLVNLRLTPLDRDEGLAFAEALAPSLNESAREEVWHRAAGNPFWMELLARSRDEGGLERLVADRLAGIGQDGAVLLTTLVLVGRPLMFDEVNAVHHWQSARSRQAADQLSATGLVVYEGAALRPAHDLVRAAAELQISAPERTHAHERIAVWLESDQSADPSRLLMAIEHRRKAGVPIRDAAAWILRSERRQALGPDGTRRLLNAIDGEMLHPLDLGLLEAAAELAVEVGLHTVALERWRTLGELLTTPAGRARALLAASEAAQALERGDEAKQFIARARENEPKDLALEIALDASEASILRWTDHRADKSHELSLGALQRAREQAAAHGIDNLSFALRKAYLRALTLEFANAQQGAPGGMVALADEIARVATGFDPRANIESYLRTGVALLFGMRPADGCSRLESAWIEARRAVLPDLILDAGNWLVRARYVLGRLGDAAEVVEECETFAARSAEVTRPLLQARVIGHAIKVSRVSPVAGFDALRELSTRESDPHYRLEINQRIATWLGRLEGERAATETNERLELALADAELAGCDRCLGELLLAGAEAYARVGNEPNAMRWIRNRSDRGVGSPRGWLPLRAEASIAIVQGADSQALLERTVAKANELEMKLEEVWALIDLAVVLSRGQKNKAVEILQAARELAMKIDALTEQRIAEQRLRAGGVRIWRRPSRKGEAGDFGALSEREREVARLVSQGASNPEIAEVLFLSRKTVERHLSTILAKLRLKNRTELAAKVIATKALESK